MNSVLEQNRIGFAQDSSTPLRFAQNDKWEFSALMQHNADNMFITLFNTYTNVGQGLAPAECLPTIDVLPRRGQGPALRCLDTGATKRANVLQLSPTGKFSKNISK